MPEDKKMFVRSESNALPQTGEKTENKTGIVGLAIAFAGLMFGLCFDKKWRKD